MKTSVAIAVALVGAVGVGCASDDFGGVAQGSGVVQDPVVFVHGCYPGPPLAPPPYENASAAQFFGPMIGYFLNNGYTTDDVFQYLYPGAVCGDINDMALDLANYIDNVRSITGHGKVDIVTHSMGGLVVRRFVANEGRDWVRDVAIVAGTNHGTVILGGGLADYWQSTFGYPAYQGAKQMDGAYACEGEAADDVQFELNGCLTDTGRTVYVDETPGPGDAIGWLNIYLTNDEVNVPADTACLNQDFRGDCSDPVNVAISTVQPDPNTGLPAHVMSLFTPAIIDMVFDHLTHHLNHNHPTEW